MQDLSIACGTPTHEFMKIVGAVVIGLAGFGIPLLLALTLYRRRRQLFSPATFRSLGFLYDGYAVDRGLYAFESVAMIRKASAVMIGNLVTDAFAQLASALMLLTTITVLQLLLQPFAVGIWAALDTLSMASLLATLALSLMYLRWSAIAGQCAGLTGSDVLTGTVLSCEQVRAEASATEVTVTVILLLMQACVLGTFAVAYVRLMILRRQRLRVRSALVDAAVAAARVARHRVAAQHVIPDAAARLAEAGLQALLAADGIANTPQRAGAAEWSRCMGLCGWSRSPPFAPVPGRRASVAVLEFIKGTLKPRTDAVTAEAAEARACVSPAMVTSVAAELCRRHAHDERRLLCFIRLLRCCMRMSLTPLDSGLHAACESSEATTARVFGPGGTAVLAATTAEGNAAFASGSGKLSSPGKADSSTKPLALPAAEIAGSESRSLTGAAASGAAQTSPLGSVQQAAGSTSAARLAYQTPNAAAVHAAVSLANARRRAPKTGTGRIAVGPTRFLSPASDGGSNPSDSESSDSD